MITIRAEHIIAIRQRNVEGFVLECTEFIRNMLPEWYSRRSKAEVDSFARSMIEFAISYNVRKEVNIQRLIFHEVYFQFRSDISPFELYRLGRPALEEDYRIAQFVDSLRTNQRKELLLLSVRR